MENVNILITMGTGIASAFLLFFLFHLWFKWSGRLSAVLTVLIVWAVYFPLAYLYWPGIDVFAIHFAFFSMTAYGLGIVTYIRDGSKDRSKLGWFHWAPASIVCFFLVLTIVDSNIIAIAQKYAPGVVAHDFRQKENQYNEYLARLETQKQRGWEIAGGWDETPVINQLKPFEVTVTDKDGARITEAEVQAKYLSTADPKQDQMFVLKELSPGVYGTETALNVPGRWTVVVSVKRGEDFHEVKGQIDVDPETSGS